MRIFIDTNVLVSGFATRGLSADVVRLVLAEHDLVTGEGVLAELRRVLRDKMKVPAPRIEAVEALLRRYPVVPVPTTLPGVPIRDADDLLVLASAIAAGAEVLVTGDRDLLDVRDAVPAPRIITPRELWELLRQG
ncbi:putative toxin-antitoxin system toxin component, PIN family [Rhodothermaceae bacterium RA]|nr:putative toxin-antitoxin system toxin component, PIN family [Rhodothermaceae bacterium RA]